MCSVLGGVLDVVSERDHVVKPFFENCMVISVIIPVSFRNVSLISSGLSFGSPCLVILVGSNLAISLSILRNDIELMMIFQFGLMFFSSSR